MPMKPGKIRFGTCTWNYPSWMGLVYTKTQRTAADYLPEYTRSFQTAEIDSWFYRMPERRDVLAYDKSTPDGFRFTCKVPQDISLTHLRTHEKDVPLVPNAGFLSVDLWKRFLDRIEPLRHKLDAVMLEFEYLNRQKMSGLTEFIDRIGAFLNAIPKGVPLALEPRNSNYMKEEYFRFVQKEGIIHVFSEKEFMPPIYELYAKYSEFIQGSSVVRLMGGNRKEIEEKTGEVWNAIVDARPDLPKVAEMIKSLSSKLDFVTVNVNNHYEGSAPLTIKRIRDLIGSG